MSPTRVRSIGGVFGAVNTEGVEVEYLGDFVIDRGAAPDQMNDFFNQIGEAKGKQ